MEKITLTVPASREVSGRALAGVVGFRGYGGAFHRRTGPDLNH